MATIHLEFDEDRFTDIVEKAVLKAFATNLLRQCEPRTDPDQWFNLDELCNYLPDRPAKQTIYGWIHTGLIPSHKNLKKLRFLKSEIDLWLKSGRRKTQIEMAADASQYLTKKKLKKSV